LVDAHVSMSEVARRLRLTLPAVSNWRRRHPSFPASVETDGQELFSVEEMAGWLDSRRISKKKLGPDELLGMTYGTRFRNAMDIAHASPDDMVGVLWRELVRLRGAGDIAVFADLTLTLLYLANTDDDRWNDIAAADGLRRGRLVGSLYRDPLLLELYGGSPALLDGVLGDHPLVEIIGLVERVRRGGAAGLGCTHAYGNRSTSRGTDRLRVGNKRVRPLLRVGRVSGWRGEAHRGTRRPCP
jgi:type I restriction enzyme M protein